MIDKPPTNPDWRMRSDMENAPTGKPLLLINLGGVLVKGILTNENRKHFIEWAKYPKRALRKEKNENTNKKTHCETYIYPPHDLA